MPSAEFNDQDVSRYWDENADTWADDVSQGYDAYWEQLNMPAFFRFVGDLSGRKVLDAGCGEGRNTRLLARAGAQVVGVDISPKMLSHARLQEEQEPLGIRYEEVSFSDLGPFGDDSFDAVVSFMALMDGTDYEGALSEFFRVMRPGGVLAFNILHPCFLTKGFGWLQDDEGNPSALTVSHYFTRESRVEHWRFGRAPRTSGVPSFAIPRFPRTLSDYVNGIIRAGFVLKAIEEPRPTEEACHEIPTWQRWRDHAGVFLYFKADKPVG